MYCVLVLIVVVLCVIAPAPVLLPQQWHWYRWMRPSDECACMRCVLYVKAITVLFALLSSPMQSDYTSGGRREPAHRPAVSSSASGTASKWVERAVSQCIKSIVDPALLKLVDAGTITPEVGMQRACDSVLSGRHVPAGQGLGGCLPALPGAHVQGLPRSVEVVRPAHVGCGTGSRTSGHAVRACNQRWQVGCV